MLSLSTRVKDSFVFVLLYLKEVCKDLIHSRFRFCLFIHESPIIKFCCPAYYYSVNFPVDVIQCGLYYGLPHARLDYIVYNGSHHNEVHAYDNQNGPPITSIASAVLNKDV